MVTWEIKYVEEIAPGSEQVHRPIESGWEPFSVESITLEKGYAQFPGIRIWLRRQVPASE